MPLQKQTLSNKTDDAQKDLRRMQHLPWRDMAPLAGIRFGPARGSESMTACDGIR